MSNLIQKSTWALKTWKRNLKVFSYITIDPIVINCKCYKKVVFLWVSPILLKQKSKQLFNFEIQIFNSQQISNNITCFKHIQVSKFLHRKILMSAKSLQTSQVRHILIFQISGKYYFYYLLKFFAETEWSKKVKHLTISL